MTPNQLTARLGPRLRQAWAGVVGCLLVTLAHAQDPGLAIRFTQPLGATDGRHCQSPAEAPVLPGWTEIVLTDADLANWDSRNATASLTPAAAQRLGPAGLQALTDRCFEIWLDGRRGLRGLSLSVHSARGSDLPRLAIGRAPHSPDDWMIQLSGGKLPAVAWQAQIDAVMAAPSLLAAQMARARRASGEPYDPAVLARFAQQWRQAVATLIEQRRLASQVPIDTVMQLLGPATVTQEAHAARRHFWLFTLGTRELAGFWAEEQQGRMTRFQLSGP